MGAEHWVPVSKPTLLALPPAQVFSATHGPAWVEWSEHVAILSPAGGDVQGTSLLWLTDRLGCRAAPGAAQGLRAGMGADVQQWPPLDLGPWAVQGDSG